VPVALELAAAVSAWPAVVDLVRGENVMLGALLAEARPVAVGERELTLAFPAGAAFLKRKAEQDDYRRTTVEALRTVTGQQLALRYELRDGQEEERPNGEVLSGEELVRRFLEEFDAEELPDNDEE
jgi:DNA polymerase-3 subunit gamma/tau